MRRLPRDVKEAIVSVDYKAKLQEITHRQKLLIDQAAKVEMETTLVMIGLEPLADYVANLQTELSVSETRAKEIALDVSDNIFKSIRDSLRAMNEPVETEASRDEQATATKAPGWREKIIGEDEPVTKFTNTNETNLNRDQILNEIEDPSIISGGDRTMAFGTKIEKPVVTTQEIEIRPAQAIETVPGQIVKDISQNTGDTGHNIFESKMTSPTVISQQVINTRPENKLPEVNKNRPTSGVDPYREPIN